MKNWKKERLYQSAFYEQCVLFRKRCKDRNFFGIQKCLGGILLILKLILSVFELFVDTILRICLHKKSKCESIFVDLWVLGKMIFSVMIFISNSINEITLIFLIVFLSESVVVILFNLVVLNKTENREASAVRTIILLLIGYFQVIFTFGSFYLSVNSSIPKKELLFGSVKLIVAILIDILQTRS